MKCLSASNLPTTKRFPNSTYENFHSDAADAGSREQNIILYLIYKTANDVLLLDE